MLAISIINTFILFVTAIIIIWYTCETYKIRKDNGKQIDILKNQNIYLQKEYKIEINIGEIEENKKKTNVLTFLRLTQNNEELTIDDISSDSKAIVFETPRKLDNGKYQIVEFDTSKLTKDEDVITVKYKIICTNKNNLKLSRIFYEKYRFEKKNKYLCRIV